MRTVTRRGANHGLHLFLTIITLGFWSPVWLIVALVGRREVTTVRDAYAVRTAWDHSEHPHRHPYAPYECGWNQRTGRWE